jgi:hypothetical protein
MVISPPSSSTTSAATNFGANIGATTVLASAGGSNVYLFIPTVWQSLAGVGCGAGSNTVIVNAIYTPPGGTPQTVASATFTITANGAIGSVPAPLAPLSIPAAASTNIQFSTTSVLASAGCSPVPQYTASVKVLN